MQLFYWVSRTLFKRGTSKKRLDKREYFAGRAVSYKSGDVR